MADRARMQVIPADSRAATYQVHFDEVVGVVGAGDTAGELLLIRTVTAPGQGSPFHTHPAREVFYIVEGRFAFITLHDGAVARYEAGAGAVIHVPPEVPHRYENVGERDGHMLVLFTPGAAMQAFFAAVDRLSHGPAEALQPGTPEYLAESRAIGLAHGLRRVSEPA